MITDLQENEAFSKILNNLAETLDITEKQHQDVVNRYQAVGDWLAQEDSLLSPYKPEITPQGSFLIGTMIKAVNEGGELDIDAVCQLKGKQANWTQFDVKKIVGDRLKDHGTYKKMIDEEGRRCWTLHYAESLRFHMDILPALVAQGYDILLEKSFSERELERANELLISITDNTLPNYWTSTDPSHWPSSNPFGYAIWFLEQASLEVRKSMEAVATVQPVPNYTKNKLPLQQAVQLLKRHRDIMFNGDEHRPISIIITTLAARAYQKETDVTMALLNIVAQMSTLVEERYVGGRIEKWIPNPVNPAENFADKWAEYPQKEENFYRWLTQVKHDVREAIDQRGLHLIEKAMERPFGQRAVTEAFSKMGNQARQSRENGQQKMAAGTGILGSVGATVKNHNFYGKSEE
ncbi:nucleotidyltransferase domain-containing protein [Tunicatimonas pelagia]|uniref:nucleotidyltransferase domain-containing protein n=1 Tax=Tunicatimonas pelagia TaxID=931531 RepID=UPI002665082E|nr:nucleotidyltransferase [Tunicatimonas pelagia]WKN42906.1 nucleotidyltransferase [Tunicatimonas pelagia]